MRKKYTKLNRKLIYIALGTLFLLSVSSLWHRLQTPIALGNTESAPKADFAVIDRTDVFFPDSSLMASAGPISLEITEDNIKEMIINKARENGIVTQLALDLAEIESQFNPVAKNPRSSAKGTYQWIDSSWESLCNGNVLDYHDNIDCTMKVLGKDIKNIKHWTVDENTKEKLAERGWVF